MPSCLTPPLASSVFADPADAATPIWFAHPTDWTETTSPLPAAARRFAQAIDFSPAPGKILTFLDDNGQRTVIFCLDTDQSDPFLVGKLPSLLSVGVYQFANLPPNPELATLAFLMSSYVFSHYKTAPPRPRLHPPANVDIANLTRLARATAFARDLINTPANDLGPDEMSAAAQAVTEAYGAQTRIVRGAELEQEFPLIAAVGQAAARPPCLFEARWGNPAHPMVTIVGKGVCFDTGGINVKPESAMALMKKDMGGAAAALALAMLVMDANLSVRLRLVLPIAENSVSGAAFRPGDIYRSRKGLSVEIGHTDAEGRLILADALALADEEAPDLLLDFATLTGAARVALGPDLPPFFTQDDALALDIARHGTALNDPVWRLPLWRPYAQMLESKISDLNNAPGGGFAGAITAALFLQRFVEKAKSWVHFDIYGWRPTEKPGRPEGGEAQAIRLIYSLLHARYGARNSS